jgi:hypothetical protein
MKKYLTLFLALSLLASCSTQRFSLNPNSKREIPKSAPHFTKTSHFFFGGIGQDTFLNAFELCKDEGGLAYVETRLSFAQGLMTLLSYNIYAPRTNNIYCNK